MSALMLTLAALVACSGSDTPIDSGTTGPATDSGTTTGIDDTADTENPNLDQDHDGYKAFEDCDDLDAKTHPGAEELCDQADNDCDGAVDEGFDSDGDGALSAALCEHGDDCDDTDGAAFPGATETWYDGTDQDCDGADLIDVDGDGFDALVAGGSDCDDNDSAIHPGAEDLPKDGVDSDCLDGDNIDGDGDGHGDRDLGGDDCDDTDPTIHPDAIDWLDDGENRDCDGGTSGRNALDSWGMTVVGASGSQDLVGYYTALCDLDEDGLAEVIIGAPFGDSYAGQVGVFAGASWSTWGPDMAMTDADTLIAGGSRYAFFGAGVGCADLDGDGHLDLVIGNSEADISTLGIDADYGLYVFYGDGYTWPANLTRADADASFTLDMAPVDPTLSTVYLNDFRTPDLDGDGAAEIVVMVGSEGLSIYDGETRMIVLQGDRWSGDAGLEESAVAILTTTDQEGLTGFAVLADLDGDGGEELALGQPEYTVPGSGDSGDAGDTGAVFGDSGDTGFSDEDPDFDYGAYLAIEGRVELLGHVPTGAGSVTDQVSLTISGMPALFLGAETATGDFDGDGAVDLAVSAYGDADQVLAIPGAIYVFSDVANDVAGGDFDVASASDGWVLGDEDYGTLGTSIASAGDADADGRGDLWVLEPSGGTNDEGWLHLLGGEYLFGAVSVEDAAMLSFYGSNASDGLGFGLRSGGDVDGDGVDDLVVGAPGYTTGAYEEGRAFLLLSSDW